MGHEDARQLYNPLRAGFSRRMSEIAFAVVYGPVLQAVAMERMDAGPGGPTDPDLRGTDVVLLLRSGRRVTVAERFRLVHYLHFDDVTMRFRSLVTGHVLELAGLNAQYMLYAVTDAEDYTGGSCLLRWDLLNGPRLLEVVEAWVAAKHKENANRNGSSTFVGIPRPVLFRAGAVVASSHAGERMEGLAESAGLPPGSVRKLMRAYLERVAGPR